MVKKFENRKDEVANAKVFRSINDIVLILLIDKCGYERNQNKAFYL